MAKAALLFLIPEATMEIWQGIVIALVLIALVLIILKTRSSGPRNRSGFHKIEIRRD